MKNRQGMRNILAVLALLLCIWLPAQAAEGNGIQLSMETDNAKVQVGENLTVTLRADQAFTTRGTGFTLNFDDTVWTLDSENSSTATPLTISRPVTVNGQNAVRISFLPGSEEITFSKEQPLAVLQFTAVSVSQKSGFKLEGAYLYDSQLAELPLMKPATVNVEVAPSEVRVPVTGISLEPSALSLEEGEQVKLKATVLPAGASDPSVIWTSSNETVAKVTNGEVKALREGEATITATTKDGGFTASCRVTVKVSNAGYTVKLPMDRNATLGEVIQIPIVVGSENNKTKYNAFDITLTYDPSVLALVTQKLPDVTISTSSGKVNVLGYGESRKLGSAPFILEFKTQTLGDTEVKITSARVDNSGNAAVKNAARANVLDGSMMVSVGGYSVTLPENFTGDAVAMPNVAYTFSRPEDHYKYKVTVTVGGESVKVTDHGDGTYTIPAAAVTGNIVVKATKTGKTFPVMLGIDMTGASVAQYGVDYIATITRDEAYRYTVRVTMGGEEYTGYMASGNTYTIPGGDITGEIVFEVSKSIIPKPSIAQKTYHKVTIIGSGAGAAQGNANSVVHGGTYTLKLKQETGYQYNVSFSMGSKPAEVVSPNAAGMYTIANVTAPLEITVEKTATRQVTVTEYLNMNETTAFLIKVTGGMESGKVFTFDGNTMYYSEADDAWLYLYVSQEDFDADAAEQFLSSAKGSWKIIPDTEGDADLNGTVDLEDAKMINGIYNGKYTNFDEIGMIKILSSDVNRDQKLDVRDVAAVVYYMMNSKEG